MRLLDLLGAFIARLAGKIDHNELAEAHGDVESMAKKTVGLPLAILENNPPDALEDLISGPVEKDHLRILAAATILDLRGQIAYQSGDEIAANRFWVNSACLFTTAAKSPDRDIAKRSREQIEDVHFRLRELNIPRHLHRCLADYYEWIGLFSQAEDHLYLGLEGEAERIETIRDFYERLLELPDETLEAGNLPRSEILQSDRELK